MITRIVINHVKEGHKGEYIEVSKAFLKELKETCGLIEGGVFEVEEAENDVIRKRRRLCLRVLFSRNSCRSFSRFLTGMRP